MLGDCDWFIDLSGESPVAIPSSTDSLPPAARRPKHRPGDLLANRFELISELGSGGAGVVYHARELSSGRSVAIKLLSGSLSSKQRERFRREGEVTAALRHPGIVAIHGAGEVNGAPFLVYELVEGGRTLGDLITDGAPREELLVALRQAAEALGAAHAQGVIHRDVKPGNLLVTHEGRVRVADFGLTRAAGMEALTASGDMLGTPCYMAFEQFEGNHAVGPAADVWALGVILHELLTGALPFEGSNLVELIGKVRDAPVDPRSLAPDLEPKLEAVCKRALQRDPGKRYRDASAFAQDLARALCGEAPQALTSTRRVPPWALLLGGIGLLVASLLFARSPGETLSQALLDHDAGRASSSTLRAALAANASAPPLLRASAHRRLARGQGGDRDAWSLRLTHADEALVLSPRLVEVRHLRARALVELGRYADAARESLRAHQDDPDAEHLLEAAQRLASCSRWEEARALLQAMPSPPSNAASRFAQLEAQIALGLGGGAEALAAARPQLTATATAILEDELARLQGGEPLAPLLRRALGHPDDPHLCRALIRRHVERGELAEALEIVKRAPAESELPAALGETLQALGRSRVHDAARHLERSWKLTLGRCLARFTRRELDLARQTEDPRYESAPKALSAEERRRRAKRYQRFLRDELPGEGLWTPPQAQPGSARAILNDAARGLEANDASECVRALEAYAHCDDYDLGPYELLRRVLEGLSQLDPPAATRLQELLAIPPSQELAEAPPGTVTPPATVRPYDPNANYLVASASLRADPASSLKGWVLAASRAPRLLRNLRADLFWYARSDQLFGEGQRLQELTSSLEGTAWLNVLARATLEAQIVEREGGRPTTAALDRVLTEAPGLTFARVLRLFVLVRAGRTIAAREELGVLREANPDDLYSTTFLNALLLAKEGAPIPEVAAAVRAAYERGFRVRDLWRDEDYPELLPYLENEEIRELLRTRRERRTLRRR